LRLDLEKKSSVEWRTVETVDTLACIGSAPTFYDAAEIAVRNMVERISRDLGVAKVDAYMLVSATGDLRLNQACRSPSKSASEWNSRATSYLESLEAKTNDR
jgi:acetamidase/formamidase